MTIFCPHDQSNILPGAGTMSRTQKPLSIMVWVAVTATGKILFVFMPTGVKINTQEYISTILEEGLKPWADAHFRSEP